MRWLAVAAVIVVMFLGGYAAGNERPQEATHVLLVHPLAHDSGDHAPEYGAWARKSRLVGGEELSGDGWVLDARSAERRRATDVDGYFLIRARDDAEALRIAKTCPHLRHGGTLELRRVQR